jgi:hypothetical protein
MPDLWSRSSLAASTNCTPVEGETPEEVGYHFATTVDTRGLSEADLLHAAIADAENWSDNATEQGQYLYGLKRGLGL